MRRVGLLLVVAGIIGLLLSGVTVSRPRELARVGSVRLQVHEERRPLLPRWIGATALLAGVVVAAAGRRRSTRSPDDARIGRHDASDPPGMLPADGGSSRRDDRRPDGVPEHRPG